MSNKNQFQLVQGEDVELIIKFELENGDAFDLTNTDSIEARFKKSDKTVMTKTLADGISVVGALPINGKIKILMDDTDTASLLVGEQDFEVTLSEGTLSKIKQFPRGIKVDRRLV